jgi:hypothetical protein
MESTNAFIGKSEKPSEAEILAALGAAADAWIQFIEWMAREHSVTAQEWKSLAPKYGWSVRLKVKNRNIVYLGPCTGSFQVSFVLGDRAMNAARRGQFPRAVSQVIAEAPHYAEGTGLRLVVHGPKDLAPIRKLAEIKLAN